jgi:hypothetical protein
MSQEVTSLFRIFRLQFYISYLLQLCYMLPNLILFDLIHTILQIMEFLFLYVFHPSVFSSLKSTGLIVKVKMFMTWK